MEIPPLLVGGLGDFLSPHSLGKLIEWKYDWVEGSIPEEVKESPLAGETN